MRENRRPSSKVNKSQIAIGVAALLVGSLVYIIDRSPHQTYFLYKTSTHLSLHGSIPNLFGSIGNSLPAFIHVFSFILITASVISRSKEGYLIICLSWFLLECAFELGQRFDTWSLTVIPCWFTRIPFLENTGNYFLRGTFDFHDLAAIALGTVTGFFVLLTTMERR